jgi:hypothetical protein
MYCSSYMFRYYIAILRERTHHVTRHNTPIHYVLSTAPQLSISQKALAQQRADLTYIAYIPRRE